MLRFHLRTCLLALPAIALAMGSIAPDIRKWGSYQTEAYLSTEGRSVTATVRKLTSEPVLSRVLDDPRVATLPSFRDARNPQVLLRERLRFEPVPDAGVVRLVCHSSSNDEAAILLDAFITASDEIWVLARSRMALSYPIVALVAEFFLVLSLWWVVTLGISMLFPGKKRGKN